MKKTIYVTLFTLLGLSLATVVHALIEIPVLALLDKDFGKYGLGLSWNTWYTIHHTLAGVLWISGAVIGYEEGQHWWRYIYVDKKLERHRK